MQLDHTRLAIRERTYLELLDFGMRVFRSYAGPILVVSSILILPLMLLNWWLIGWIASDEYTRVTIPRYAWLMAQLVFVEAPVAGSLLTLYLGGTTFMQDQTVRQLLGELWSLLPRVILSQGLLRGVILAWILAYNISADLDFSLSEFWLSLLCAAVLLLRLLRPYLPEIVLLERNPYRSRNKLVATIRQRASSLHGPNSGDLFGRGLSTIPVAVLLVASLFATIWFVIGVVSNDWSWTPWLVHLVLPGSYWFVAIYLTVVRFLTYLDLRIRREGWEVELKMKAEGVRLQNQFT